MLQYWLAGQLAVQLPPQPSSAPPHLPEQLGVQQELLWQKLEPLMSHSQLPLLSQSAWLASQMHRPEALQVSPAPQDPQEPPQSFEPHSRPEQLGMQLLQTPSVHPSAQTRVWEV